VHPPDPENREAISLASVLVLGVTNQTPIQIVREADVVEAALLVQNIEARVASDDGLQSVSEGRFGEQFDGKGLRGALDERAFAGPLARLACHEHLAAFACTELSDDDV
jgi:hypothetical protein